MNFLFNSIGYQYDVEFSPQPRLPHRADMALTKARRFRLLGRRPSPAPNPRAPDPAGPADTQLAALAAVVLDTETTGLDVASDRIVALGAVKVLGGRVLADASFDLLVAPGIAIPARASAIHGITDAMVADAARFEAVFAAFEEFRSGAAVIGHDLGFDLALLRRGARRAGHAWQPPALDTALLVAVLEPALARHDLADVAAHYGIDPRGRHSALGDAAMTAELFVRLIPLLAERGVTTLGQAQAFAARARRALAAQHAAGWWSDTRRANESASEAMNASGKGKADVFPFRRRVADVMSTPLVAVAPTATLAEAARAMAEHGVSSVVIDGAAGLGIVTERDVVRAVAAGAADALAERHATRPVHGVAADAFVYVALGRLARLGVRHLVVRDKARPVGMVTARALLRLRAAAPLALGDGIAEASDAAGLGRVHASLPALARQLLADGLDARAVAQVIGAVVRDMTGRAAELAAAELEAERGPAPAPWCCLVLGSAGRGESLLAADQDNALIHQGAPDEPWFAAQGERLAAILDAAGLPLCQGGIMASRPAWRHTPAAWRELIEGWVDRAAGTTIPSVDAFFDFRAVAGDVRLADQLREAAMAAARAPMLPRMLARELSGFTAPIGRFGRLRTEAGRIDLKFAGLHPIVGAARVIALGHGIAATGTAERLALAQRAGAIAESELAPVDEAHERFVRLVLEQQIADLDAGVRPGSTVDVARLSAFARRGLKESLGHAARFADGAMDRIRFG